MALSLITFYMHNEQESKYEERFDFSLNYFHETSEALLEQEFDKFFIKNKK